MKTKARTMKKQNVLAYSFAIAMGLGICGFTPAPVLADAAYYRAMTLSMNPVAYYKLDETSGVVSVDSSVNTNNGSDNVYATHVAGIVSNAAHTIFYGVITAPSTYVNFDVANGFTLEGWIKTTETALNGIITHYTSASLLGYWLGDIGGTLYMQIRNGSGNYALERGTAIINDGQWHYVAATHAAGGNTFSSLKLYVDGKLDTPSSTANLGTLTTFANPSQPLYLGYLDNNQISGSGLSVDEAAIYNTALSGAQILKHFNSLTNMPPPRGTIIFVF